MFKRLSFILVAVISLNACSSAQYAAHVAKKIPLKQDTPSKSIGHFKVGSSYVIKGKRYYPVETYNFTETGSASWYGPGFHGKQTANGEMFDQNELTAAHRTLQLPCIIQVTNLDNGRQVILRVNDRGPFAHNRILDVSERAAVLLGFKEKGVANIRLEVMADASKEIASLAKSGKSTKGTEIAYNQQNARKLNRGQVNSKQVSSVLKTQQGSQENIIPSVNTAPASNVFANNNNLATTGTSQNAALAKVESQSLEGIIQDNVRPNSTLTAEQIDSTLASGRQMYVQAGAFSQEDNALNYSNKLADLGPSRVYSTQVNNSPYYRVRLGPYTDVKQAQTVLNSLNYAGNNNAVIIID